MNYKLIDVALVRDLLGVACIQLMFQCDDGHEFKYQWPLKMGTTVMDASTELHRLADGIVKHQKLLSEAKK